MDEMRYGTRTDSKRRWTRQGRRPKCPVKLGYEWGYLYLAVAPFSGDVFACFATHLDKDCFTHFGELFKEHLSTKQINAPKFILIGDGATAHQQKCLPKEIEWVKLPTACPELNPAERFFKELRSILSNRIFQSKKEVEQVLKYWIKQYQKDPQKVIKLTKFSFLEYAN